MIFVPHKLGFIDFGSDRPALKSPIYCWIGFSACGENSALLLLLCISAYYLSVYSQWVKVGGEILSLQCELLLV